MVGGLGCSLSVVPMVIVGEPVEKLFLWGHSSCVLDDKDENKVMVFGGFGGMGRHARRSESLLLNPFSGTLKVINLEGSPTPRLGHTCSLAGDCVFVIGGRADPVSILDDVWVLNTAKSDWRLAGCIGSVFPPR
jgi:tRNA wybutosine-synthesizing protein 3